MSQIEKESSKPLWRIRKIPAIQNAESNTLFAAPKTAASILSVQAPGLKTQAGIYWKDKSGDRLREWPRVWIGHWSGYFAVLPMDFYFQGIASQIPPRTGLQKNGITNSCKSCPISINSLGQYAQAYYLHEKNW